MEKGKVYTATITFTVTGPMDSLNGFSFRSDSGRVMVNGPWSASDHTTAIYIDPHSIKNIKEKK